MGSKVATPGDALRSVGGIRVRVRDATGVSVSSQDVDDRAVADFLSFILYNCDSFIELAISKLGGVVEVVDIGRARDAVNLGVKCGDNVFFRAPLGRR